MAERRRQYRGAARDSDPFMHTPPLPPSSPLPCAYRVGGEQQLDERRRVARVCDGVADLRDGPPGLVEKRQALLLRGRESEEEGRVEYERESVHTRASHTDLAICCAMERYISARLVSDGLASLTRVS